MGLVRTMLKPQVTGDHTIDGALTRRDRMLNLFGVLDGGNADSSGHRRIHLGHPVGGRALRSELNG
jgi:hypothetical protein